MDAVSRQDSGVWMLEKLLLGLSSISLLSAVTDNVLNRLMK